MELYACFTKCKKTTTANVCLRECVDIIIAIVPEGSEKVSGGKFEVTTPVAKVSIQGGFSHYATENIRSAYMHDAVYGTSSGSNFESKKKMKQ